MHAPVFTQVYSAMYNTYVAIQRQSQYLILSHSISKALSVVFNISWSTSRLSKCYFWGQKLPAVVICTHLLSLKPIYKAHILDFTFFNLLPVWVKCILGGKNSQWDIFGDICRKRQLNLYLNVAVSRHHDVQRELFKKYKCALTFLCALLL